MGKKYVRHYCSDINGVDLMATSKHAFGSTETELPTYSLNTFYAALGGYVIEVRDGGKRGVVCAMQDQGTSNGHAVSGMINVASNHDSDGVKFLDWRLPEAWELYLLYDVYANGNAAGLNAGNYWSGSGIGAGFSNYAIFNADGGGSFGGSVHDTVNSVRAVRTF